MASGREDMVVGWSHYIHTKKAEHEQESASGIESLNTCPQRLISSRKVPQPSQMSPTSPDQVFKHTNPPETFHIQNKTKGNNFFLFSLLDSLISSLLTKINCGRDFCDLSAIDSLESWRTNVLAVSGGLERAPAVPTSWSPVLAHCYRCDPS